VEPGNYISMENHGILEGMKVKGLDSKLPRVLVVDLSIRYGGASTRALSIAKYFLPGGSMIAGIENSPVIRIAREQGIPVKIVGKSRTDPRIPFRLAQAIHQEGIQVVDTQNIQSKFWVSLTALLADFVFVSTLNSFYIEEFGSSWKSRIYHFIDLVTNWKTDKFMAVSEKIRDGLLDDGIPPGKVVLIRNAIEVPDEHVGFDASSLRKRFGIPNNALLCVLVGRLVWAKGFDDFISAFSILVGRFENIKAVIVGDGGLRNDIDGQIDKLGLKNFVLLLGHQERSVVLQILKSADMFVMPSRSEGIPYALLEAAALGLPIVATNCGGIPEVVTDGKSALLVPVGDVSSLANAIISLGSDSALARNLGDSARKNIIQNYSLDAQMGLTEKVYLQCLYEKAEK
jgi:glycosyltransferase involved in cell wall biosynthesis